MANALLYYRTENTRTVDVSPVDYSDPFDLPSSQKLEFIFPNDILESINESYQNNVKQSPVPNQDGTRKINIQENGLSSYGLSINGVFKKDVVDGIQKLKLMRKTKQVDNYHVHGKFGLKISNASEYDLDPTNLSGFHIISTNVGYFGVRNTRYDFTINLGFGGSF